MKHQPPTFILALAIAMAVPAASAQDARSGAALAPDALFARVSPSVWVVQTHDAQGKVLATGSAVATGAGTAVTNCQLLAKAAGVALKRDNVSYGATLVFPDVARDLCQLRIPNFSAPPIGITPANDLQVGMPLHIVGSPRGKELTLGIGMLAGLRRNDTGELEALQLAAQPEAGLGGAGLFDAQGRLAGLVSAATAGSGSANLAIPASWIAELPLRGQLAIERLATQPAALSGGGIAAPGQGSGRPNVIEYQLHDRLTNVYRKVVYRADPATDDRISFNSGGWIEKPGGEVISVTSAVAGEFDTAMPPGGWAKENLKEEAAWKKSYSSTLGGIRINMDLSATVMEDTVLTVGGQEFKVVRIEYRGFTQRFANAGAVSGNQYGPYRAEVWFSPELGRVIRFEAKTRGGASSGAFQVNEALELVSLR
ncbi:S1 family peptidase [Variovorax paradoxus]|uniref:S1 family peptidase n=1 Tax=Variovorax paradoxus TaxID=34073 RepID=UPI0029C68252|nr:serine protease [Variovorax paradoxus]